MAKMTMAEIGSAMVKAGWPPETIAVGIGIAMAESGGDPTVRGGPNRNGTYDYGLFQINSIHNPTAQNWADPVVNAAMALKVYREAGNKWIPWSTYKAGTHHKFMTEASRTAGDMNRSGEFGEAWKNAAPADLRLINAATSAAAAAAASPAGQLVGALISPVLWRTVLVVLIAVVLIVAGIVVVLRRPIGDVVSVASKGVV